MPLLEVDGLVAGWGRREVLHGISFVLAEGELLTVLGPNGSGKTTLLRAIAGFEPRRAGSVRLDGRTIDDAPPYRRSIGLLFQEPALFPRRTVLENVAYAPLLQRRPQPEIRALVDRLAQLLGLSPLLARYPDELSGGERQRVALARSLAARPRLILLDEPFASVDIEIRAGLRAEFRAALRAFGTAAVHVTHDREEAMFLGDRLALLLDGRLAAVGVPSEVFGAPGSQPAAAFLGYNLMASPRGTVAVLPEALIPEAPTPGRPGYRVLASARVGASSLSVLQGPAGERIELRGPEPLAVGAEVALRWEREVRVPAGAPLNHGAASRRG